MGLDALVNETSVQPGKGYIYYKEDFDVAFIGMNSFSSGKSFVSRTCDRDFRQDQEKATALPIGKPEGLSAIV